MISQIGELEEKVRNMLMLKFGRLVDLEKLETVTVNRTVEELKEKLRQQESKSAAEIAKWNVSNTLTRIELILVFLYWFEVFFRLSLSSVSLIHLHRVQPKPSFNCTINNYLQGFKELSRVILRFF